VGRDCVRGFCGDHRPNVGCQRVGVADAQFVHGALDHGENTISNVVLQTQHAQSRTALSCAVKGGGDDIGNDLFGER
jgi:hypothetical protein